MQLLNITSEKDVNSISFSPDGKYFVAVTNESQQNIVIWECASDGKFIARQSLNGHSVGINYVIFSPDGQFIVTLGVDKKFDESTKELIGDNSPLKKEVIENIKNSMYEPVNSLRIWKISKGLFIESEIIDGFSKTIVSGDFSPDGNL